MFFCSLKKNNNNKDTERKSKPKQQRKHRTLKVYYQCSIHNKMYYPNKLPSIKAKKSTKGTRKPRALPPAQ